MKNDDEHVNSLQPAVGTMGADATAKPVASGNGENPTEPRLDTTLCRSRLLGGRYFTR